MKKRKIRTALMMLMTISWNKNKGVGTWATFSKGSVSYNVYRLTMLTLETITPTLKLGAWWQ